MTVQVTSSGSNGVAEPPGHAKEGAAAFLRDLTNLPNLLCISRVLGIGLALVLFHLGFPYVGLALGIAAGLTDILDGYLARKLGLVTELGELIDQVADMLCVFAVISWAVAESMWPLYVLLVWGFRDITVLALRRSAAHQGFSIKTVIWGRIANHASYYSFIPLIPAMHMRDVGDLGATQHAYEVGALVLIHIGLVFYWVSGAIYLGRYMRQYRS